MSRLFISHSSRDNAYALGFRGWLAANGWDQGDVFIDLHDIDAGERWRGRLRKANAACEAVILLASPASLGSVECQEEIKLAELLGKEIITAVIRDLTPDDPRLVHFRDRQVVDLSAFPCDHVEAFTWQGQDHRIGFNLQALAKIKGRLSTLGISPGSFPWPPKDRLNAEPFPGLNAFDEDDAGIFFGRDTDILAALTKIRLVRRRRAPRLIVIDAASGAGKSSFLRAGLWPRLKRDPDFAPLAILRPSQGIITGPDGIGRRIAPFFERHQRPRSAGGIYAPLMDANEARAAQAFAGLMTEAVALATEVRRVSDPEAHPPAPLIAIDQAEEMFAPEYSAESDRLLSLLAAFLTSPPDGIDPYVLLTIRADSVQELLDRVAALGLETPEPIYLPPLSPAAYREVILRPAEIYSAHVRRLEIEPMLADALVRDASGADALPLLAFTLARLFGDFAAAEGRLTHKGYAEVGGIAGSIERALREARIAAGAVDSTKLRSLLVPALVTWDPEAADGQGAAKRLPADEGKLFAGSRANLAPLAQALVAVRLLRRDRETLEVAHEALLRVRPISDWLEEDREFLVWRDRTAKARTAYEANARGLLVGRELDIAREWLEERRDAAEIGEPERDFIAESAAADDKRREEAEAERARHAAELGAAELRARQAEAQAREAAAELELRNAREREAAAREREIAALRATRRTRVGLVVAIVLALLAYWQWREAARHAASAEDERQRAVGLQKEAEKQKKVVDDERKLAEAQREELKTLLSLIPQTGRSKFAMGSLFANQAPPDYEKAYQWYEKAAADLDTDAIRELGLLLASGRVKRDNATADGWFEMATAGDARAMAEIGRLYADGRGGMPQDETKAGQWLKRAADAGDKGALGDLCRLALFTGNFEQALAAAEEALKGDPELLWIKAYQAHALFFLKRTAQARAIYRKHKDKRIAESEDQTWQQVIKEDFVRLRVLGHVGDRLSEIAEIEAELGIAEQ